MEQLWHQDESISADLKRKSILYQLPECTRIYQVCLFCHIVLVYFQNSKKNIKMRGCNVNLCHMLMLTANNCLHRCLYFKEVGKRWLSDLRAWFIIAVHMHRIIKNNSRKQLVSCILSSIQTAQIREEILAIKFNAYTKLQLPCSVFVPDSTY